ncbi:DUF4397 domain-containing protein [Pleionea sp. CnH1-48]|uniref:DUF4397 domain-containing protein n=1 Tax=Pleionea sp. CnH1-48 TaxID=2954494 RepID=UPI00209721B6|nr:DUF4397 domain-containing protein [Pleionea sp. CnH1-48]MCO7224843.1 DUF4397 domain-containing protein [Pleionea sp. CnH1-48]
MTSLVKKWGRRLGVVAVAFSLSACEIFDDDDDAPATPAPTAKAKVEVIHASADAPRVNVYSGATPLLQNFDYAQASGLVEVDAGLFNVDVKGLLPDSSTPSVIGPVDLTLQADMIYTVIATNNVANIEPLIVSRSDSAIGAEEVRVQVVHAAVNAPMVDVYVTAPDADITASAPLGTFDFKGDLGPVTVPQGDYQIRVTPAGDNQTIAFDSGAVSLAGGSDLTIAAITNTATGSAPINLLVATGTSSFLVRDKNAGANVRVTHGSPDAPAVDIIANDNFSAPLFSNLGFTQTSDWANIPANMYNVKVVPQGATSPVVINADLDFAIGNFYSVLAVDTLDQIDALVLTEDRRRVATEAKIQIVHASPAAGNVDIYVVAPGTDINSVEATISGFALKATTNGFIGLPGGSYDVYITAAGTKDVAIGPAQIDLNAGGIYTVIARDSEHISNAQDAGAPAQLLLLDDFIL